MPILTNFMQPINPDTRHEDEIEAFGIRLSNFITADNVLRKEGIRIDSDKMGPAVSRIFRDAWDEIGYIPSKVNELDLTEYSGYGYLSSVHGPTLASYSLYPPVQLQQIKNVAEKMGFMIMPVSYADPNKMFAPYGDLDRDYYRKLNRSYDFFKHTVGFINHFFRLEEGNPRNAYQIYVLAPLTYYDPWLEVSSDNDPLPKFFSSQLSTIETMLGLIVPTQRNLYAMSKTNNENIRLLNETMQKNFTEIEKTIARFSERLTWVERANQILNQKIASLEGALTKTQLRLFELERTVACMLDPVIFAVPPKTDVSSSSSDNVEARVGLCFGPETSVDVFVTNGLVQFNSKVFKEVELPFSLRALSV